MKAKFFLSFLLILLLGLAFISANPQDIYSTRDLLYKRVDNLCMRADTIGPTSFSPLPAGELIKALNRIDTEKLSGQDLKEYDYLYHTLSQNDSSLYNDDNFSANLFTELNLFGNIANYSNFNYAHTDLSYPEYSHKEDTLIPFRYEPSLFTVGTKLNFSNFISLESKVDIKSPNTKMYESSLGMLLTRQDTKRSITRDWPYKAGGSIGNEYINLILGRFPHSTGSGITGNLVIGDNFNYQEVFNISLMSQHLNYNISITRFDPQEFVDKANHLITFSPVEFRGKQQYRIVHRLDANFLNKARLAINLGTIYIAEHGFDIRFLYPFVVGHNYYNYTNTLPMNIIDEANNIMSFETEWNITNGLRIGGQIAIDQLQMSWENKTDIPPALGGLLNLKYSTVLKKGLFNCWFESVYTNPYLYLNGKYYTDDNSIEYNLDYIVGYKMYNFDDYGYSGYVYGPDTIVFSLGLNYLDQNEQFEIAGNILYRAQGLKGLKVYSYHPDHTILDMSSAHIEQDSNIFMNNIWTPSGGWKKAEHLLKFSLLGSYNAIKSKFGNISFYSGFGMNLFFNYNHKEGQTSFQPHLMIGTQYKY